MNNENNRLAALLALVTIICLTLIALFADTGEAEARHNPAPIQCFPVMLWDANPGARPCHQIVSVEEDGSGRLELGTARRAIARCSIPNVREQRRTFTIKCWKVK